MSNGNGGQCTDVLPKEFCSQSWSPELCDAIEKELRRQRARHPKCISFGALIKKLWYQFPDEH